MFSANFPIYLFTLAVCWLTTSSSIAQTERKWEAAKINGREYISGKSIGEWYGFTSKVRKGNTLRLSSDSLSLVITANSQTLTIKGIKFIMSFAAAAHAGDLYVSRLDLAKLIDPVLNPNLITAQKAKPFDTVIIDPGHGGHDSGAVCSLGKESYFALDTARRLSDLLKKKGYKVHLTRDSDRYITLGNRVKFANNYQNAIFVSIHYNSAQSRAYGIETFALSPQGASSTYVGSRSSDHQNYTGNSRDSENIALATAIHAYSLHSVRTIDRGIKRARWGVLTGLKLPGVLFEGGFLSNPSEARNIANATHRQKLASAICEGIVNYRRALTGKK